MNLSSRLNNFPEYLFATFNKKIQQVENSSGRKVLNFGPGSPDFPPSIKLREKLCEYIMLDDSHKYPGYVLIQEFDEALKYYYKSIYNVDLESNQLLHLSGAKDAVSHITLAICDSGDEVLIPDPGYAGYSGPLNAINAIPKPYKLTKGSFKLDFSKILSEISDKTKAIWINFPSNPTGQIITESELVKLVSIAKENEILIISDCAYSQINYTETQVPSILSIPGAKDVAVEINSLSKSHSLAGYRIGWIAGNQKVIKALTKIKSQFDSGLSIPLQRIAAYSLTNHDENWHKEMLHSYKHRAQIIIDHLHQLGIEAEVPDSTFYIWAKLSINENDSMAYAIDILESRQIFFTPGIAFGENGEGYIRISSCVNIDNISEYFY